MSGRLEAIWLKRAHRGVMDPVDAAELVEAKGLVGNVDRSRRRQVTILSREAWELATGELDATLDPKARRANLLVSGLALANTRGRILRIGDQRLVIGGETTPCERMDEALSGLRTTLKPEWRGGVFAQVLTSGPVQIGDEVQWE
jgi:MOSC domain-containing protein YiiM